MGHLPREVGFGRVTGVGNLASDLHVPLDLEGRVKARVGGLKSGLDDLQRTGYNGPGSSTHTEKGKELVKTLEI